MPARELSVVIPCHNDGKYLSEAIESVLNQEHRLRFHEVVVVDGHSTDEQSVEVLEWWRREDPNPPGVEEHRAGRARQRAQRRRGRHRERMGRLPGRRRRAAPGSPAGAMGRRRGGGGRRVDRRRLPGVERRRLAGNDRSLPQGRLRRQDPGAGLPLGASPPARATGRSVPPHPGRGPGP